MIGALFDTNILIDYLLGIEAARSELHRYRQRAISVVTWMEVLAGSPDDAQLETRRFLADFKLLELDQAVADHTVSLRRGRRLKLPDAIIWATAQVHSLLLVTRNTRDFPQDEPGVRMPYRL
jgi:predicted nucleic acid-binding protein